MIQTFRGSYIRLSYNLKYCWDYQVLATPEQVEAADAATAAIDEATAKLEILKESAASLTFEFAIALWNRYGAIDSI